MGVGGGGGRVLDHEKSKWLMSISWSHGLPVPLPTYVLSVSSSCEQMDMLMRHLMFSWSHETESTWVWRGSPRPGDHENKKWLMIILFCSQVEEIKSTWVWEGGGEGA